MPPSNSDTYVTYRDMNRFMWSALGACLALVGSIVAATWKLGNDIADVRRDVAVLQVQISSVLNRTISIDGQRQYQIVLVEIPPTESELNHAINQQALYAVWVTNYGKDKADDMLHATGVGPASGEPRPASGGAGPGASGAARSATGGD